MSAQRAGGVMAYLGLGANLGDRQGAIAQALKELGVLPTITVTAVSSLYQTAPVGVLDQPDFLNAVAEVQTTLAPRPLLAQILQVEQQLGRVRTVRWGPRTIDIDILVFGEKQMEEPDLTIPHPRLAERAFALVPLAEVAPNLCLPGEDETMRKKVDRLIAQGNISKLPVV